MKFFVFIFTTFLLCSVTFCKMSLGLAAQNSVQSTEKSTALATDKTFTMNKSEYMNRFTMGWRWPRTRKRVSTVVNCGIGAITAFYYHRINAARYRYVYNCIMPPSICSGKCKHTISNLDRRYCKWHYTRWGVLHAYNGFNGRYAGNRPVWCPGNKVMTYFRQIINRRAHRVRWQWRCCPARSRCRKAFGRVHRYRNFNYVNFINIWYRSPNQHLQALKGFRFIINKRGHWWRVRVTFCNVYGRR